MASLFIPYLNKLVYTYLNYGVLFIYFYFIVFELGAFLGIIGLGRIWNLTHFNVSPLLFHIYFVIILLFFASYS